PYGMWDVDLKNLSLEFLDTIDPLYFKHIAAIHGRALDDKSEKQYAATALRAAYSQGLETLFTLLCAVAQAPTCPLGWLLKYKNTELINLVRKIHTGQPVEHDLTIDAVTWESLAGVVFR